MARIVRYLLLLAAIVLALGCAGRQPGFETPSVGVSSFRLLPAEGKAPQFEIGLHIVNPNRTALKLEGIVYSVKLNGHKVLTGADNNLPVIAAYSEGQVTLRATVDLLSSISLLGSLMNQPSENFTYELDARLDTGRLRPRLHLQEKGTLSLAAGRR
jgi:LEA14-like dessication related protein